MNIGYVVLGSAGLATAGILVIQLGYFVAKCVLYVNSKGSDAVGQNRLLIYAILMTISCVICEIFQGLFYLWIGNGINGTDIFNAFNLMASIWWYISQIFMFVYCISRLYITFSKPNYSLSLRMYVILVVFLFIFMIGIIVSIYVTIQVSENPLNKGLKLNLGIAFYIGISMSLIIAMILSSLLLILFVKKLFKMNEYIYDEYNLKMENINSQNKIKLSDYISIKQIFEDERDNIVIMASKVTILSIVTILISQAVYMTGLVRYYYYIISNPKSDNISRDILAIFGLIHMLLSPMLLFMGFSFMKNWYNYCCSNCDTIMKKLFMIRMYNKILPKEPLLNKEICLDSYH